MIAYIIGFKFCLCVKVFSLNTQAKWKSYDICLRVKVSTLKYLGMDLGCSPVTPRCRRRTQTHYSSPPARPIALRSGIRRRKSGCTGPRRLGTIGNPLNKRKVPSQGCFFFKKRVKLWLMHLPGVGVQWPQCTMHKRLQSGLLPAQATASGHFFSHQFVLWRSRQMASRLYHLSWGARLTSFVSCAWVTWQKSSLGQN